MKKFLSQKSTWINMGIMISFIKNQPLISYQYYSMSYNKKKWDKESKGMKLNKYKSYEPQTKKFQKCVENFECENCGTEVIGNGYTNHCPECFYSKHVDINPGDRKETCGGMMKPIEISPTKEFHKFTIVHKCIDCGAIRNNRSAKNDNLKNFFGKDDIELQFLKQIDKDNDLKIINKPNTENILFKKSLSDTDLTGVSGLSDEESE